MVDLQHPTFEANQVLTHTHLNELLDYLQAEDRETRVHGIGVGILGGFEVSVAKTNGKISRVDVSCGAGITTTGSLIHSPASSLAYYRKFVDADPHRYEWFWKENGGAAPQPKDGIWELVEDDGDGAKALRDATAAEGLGDLTGFVVVFYAEHREEQVEACNLEDCDDKGADVRLRVRKLLVKKEIVGEIPKPFGSQSFAPIRLERPTDFAAVNDAGSLVDLYQRIHDRAIPAVAESLAAAWWTLRDVLDGVHRRWFADPMPVSRDAARTSVELALTDLRSATPDGKIQIYYDFLRDVAATHADLIENAAKLKNWGCPDASAFPRHLALSELEPPTKTDHPEFRHEFRPWLATVGQESVVQKIRRLFRKIDLMGALFSPGQTSVNAAKIRPQPHAAPSHDVIPYYFGPPEHAAFDELRAGWDADFDPRSRIENRIWTFGEVGQTLPLAPNERDDNSLLFPLDEREFLRIEGHLGQQPSIARSRIDGLRRANALAFDTVTLELGDGDPVDFSDLCDYHEHRARYEASRHELVRRARQVYLYLESILLGGPGHGPGWLRYVNPEFPSEEAEAVLQALASWTQTITRSLDTFEEAVFREAYHALLEAAYALLAALHAFAQETTAEPYRSYHDLRDVGKSQGVYPLLVALILCQIRAHILRLFTDVDSNVLLRAWRWAEHARTERNFDNPETFLGFVRRHPGIEHAAGTTKGGTFILVHEANTVVADFYLPYRCCTPPCLGTAPPAFQECFPVYLEYEYRDAVAIFDLDILRERHEGRVNFKNVHVTLGSAKGTLTRSNQKWYYRHQKTHRAEYMSLVFPENPERWPMLVLHHPMSWLRWPEKEPGNRSMKIAVNRGFGRFDLDPASCHIWAWLHVHPRLAIASDLWVVTVMGKPVTIDLLKDGLLPDDSFEVRITEMPAHGTVETQLKEYPATRMSTRYVKYTPPGKFVGNVTFAYQVSSTGTDREPITSCGRVTVQVTDCCDPQNQPPSEPEKPEIILPLEYFCADDSQKYYIKTRGAVVRIWGRGVFSEVRASTGSGRFGRIFLRASENTPEIAPHESEPSPVRPPRIPPFTPIRPLDRLRDRRIGAGTIVLGENHFALNENIIGNYLRERVDLPWINEDTQLTARYYFVPSKANVQGAAIRIEYAYLERNREKTGKKDVHLVTPLPPGFSYEVLEFDEREKTVRIQFSYGRGYPEELEYTWSFGKNAEPESSGQPEPRVLFRYGMIQSIAVRLEVAVKTYLRCRRTMVRQVSYARSSPVRLVEKYTEIGAGWVPILRDLEEVLSRPELARLEAATEYLPFVKKVVDEGGGEKYGAGDHDVLVLEHEERQLDRIVELAKAKYDELRTKEEEDRVPAGEYTRKIEPILDLARAQIESGLNYVKYKNRPVNDKDARYINRVGHRLTELKAFGVEIDADGKTRALLRATADGVTEPSVRERLDELGKIVEAP